MKKDFLDVVKAGTAIKQLVSNVEKEEYDFGFFPVEMKLHSDSETYDIFALYKKGEKEKAAEEINEKFDEKNTSAFLTPSENYIQIAFFEEDELPLYKRSITFKNNGNKLQKGEIVSIIVDPKYEYIDEVMNRYLEFEDKLEVKKDDDIYQYIDCISKERTKKNSFVKKLFKNK